MVIYAAAIGLSCPVSPSVTGMARSPHAPKRRASHLSPD